MQTPGPTTPREPSKVGTNASDEPAQGRLAFDHEAPEPLLWEEYLSV